MPWSETPSSRTANIEPVPHKVVFWDQKQHAVAEVIQGNPRHTTVVRTGGRKCRACKLWTWLFNKKERELSIKRQATALLCGLHTGAFAMQGKPHYMEDRAVVCELRAGCVFAAIYDGHAGSGAADFAAEHFQEAVVSSPHFAADEIVEALRVSICDVSRRFIETKDDGSGATACVLVRKGKNFYVANCGDSRAVLWSGGRAVQLSKDHKATEESEKARIEQLGGTIEEGRVLAHDGENMLACSRSIGDSRFKDGEAPLVPATADIVRRPINMLDEFALVASDGVWDVMSNEEACKVVLSALEAHSDDAAIIAAETLCKAAIDKGSEDNVSAAIILLKWCS
mmetsp:Transcript_348/g.714  ORF Transcript_348/g.714 Transcript_348/m.714 type:complete len:341 (-) Transcript_348:395-1417(-)